MATREKLAVPLDFAPSIVALNNGDRMTLKEAKAKGYKIYGEPDATAPDNETAAKRTAHVSWRGAVLALPEARDREAAAAEIVNTHTADTMSVANARAFLRGLPTEQHEEQPSVTTHNDDPRAARKAEIANSMAAFNKQNGRAAKPSASAAPSLAGIDPTKLKRMAEIRLNAVESGRAGDLNEAKNLRYALVVHSQVGTPLATVFAQLGVDTSKIIRA